MRAVRHDQPSCGSRSPSHKDRPRAPAATGQAKRCRSAPPRAAVSTPPAPREPAEWAVDAGNQFGPAQLEGGTRHHWAGWPPLQPVLLALTSAAAAVWALELTCPNETSFEIVPPSCQLPLPVLQTAASRASPSSSTPARTGRCEGCGTHFGSIAGMWPDYGRRRAGQARLTATRVGLLGRNAHTHRSLTPCTARTSRAMGRHATWTESTASFRAPPAPAAAT